MTPPSPERPVVVSILTYNQPALLAECLESLFQAPPAVPFVVQVFEQGGLAAARRALERFKDRPELRVHHHAENLGFVGANNVVFDWWRGHDVVLLNDDTIVLPGWLDALAARAHSAPDAGLVGARLVYPNGALQEAGGEIFRDGTGQNIGKWDDPARPERLVARDVQYCSGACLYLRSDVLERLGGFDPQFAPAYYEDTDLCFRARAAGWRVIYEPAATIIHREGATAGVDLARGAKRHQELNRTRFVAKWRATLATHRRGPFEHPGPRQGRHLLVIHLMPPLFDQASGDRRLYELLCALARNNRVTFLAVDDRGLERYTDALRAAGVHALAGDEPRWPHYGKGGPAPRSRPTLEDVVTQNDFDVALLEFHHQARVYLPLLRRLAPTLPILVDSVDVHYLRERREAELKGDALAHWRVRRTQREELSIYERADAVITVTREDRAALLAESPSLDVRVIPNLHDVCPAPPPREGRSGLIFVGGFRHPPNVDAALWLVQEILPRIHARRPDARLTLAGSEPPPTVANLASARVAVTGYVPDLHPQLDGALVSVAPLRYGAGMKGKIGEALGRGLPVVTTSIGAEGMDLIDGAHALIADDAASFADAVLRLIEDADLWRRLSAGGRRHVAERWSVEAVAGRLDALIADPPPAAPRRSARCALDLTGAKPDASPPEVLGLIVVGSTPEATGRLLGWIQQAHCGDLDAVIALQGDLTPEWEDWAGRTGARLVPAGQLGVDDVVQRSLEHVAGEDVLVVADHLALFRSTLRELRAALDRAPRIAMAQAGALAVAPRRAAESDEAWEAAAARALAATSEPFHAALCLLIRPARLAPGAALRLADALPAAAARVLDPTLPPRRPTTVEREAGVALAVLEPPGRSARPPERRHAWLTRVHLSADGPSLGARLASFVKDARRRHLVVVDHRVHVDGGAGDEWIRQLDGVRQPFGLFVLRVASPTPLAAGSRSLLETRLSADAPSAAPLLGLARPALVFPHVSPDLFDRSLTGIEALLEASVRADAGDLLRVEPSEVIGFQLDEFPSAAELIEHTRRSAPALARQLQRLDRWRPDARFVDLARYALAGPEVDELFDQAIEILTPWEGRGDLWDSRPLLAEAVLARCQIVAARHVFSLLLEQIPPARQERHLSASGLDRRTWPQQAAGCARAVLALALAAVGARAESYESAGRAVTEAPSDYLARYALAQAALAVGRLDESRANLAELRRLVFARYAIELFPRWPAFLRGVVLDATLELRRDNPQAVIDLIDELERRRVRPGGPFGGRLLELCAAAQARLGRTREATLARLSAIALSSGVPDRSDSGEAGRSPSPLEEEAVPVGCSD